MFGNYLESLSLADAYRRRLDVIRSASPTAEDRGEQNCCRSGVCCWRRPGALSPDDVGRIAAALGVTPRELFANYLVVDTLFGKTVVLPRRKHQAALAGSLLPWRETYSLESPCVWLGDGNSCEVQDVKPTACAAFRCWDNHDDDGADTPGWQRDELLEFGWDGATDES